MDKPVVLKPNSTLNEKFGVNADILLADTDKVAVRYVGIGNGGRMLTMGANNIPKTTARPHRPRDASLYNQLPFVLRLPAEDLTVLQRAKYRMRKLEMHGGVQYVAYYLMKLDNSNSNVDLELRTVTDGVATSTAFVPLLADLNPTPPAITPGEVLQTSGDYIAATAKVPFVMSASDIAEFINVCNIIYDGDTDYAVISEIAICSGADRNVVGDFNGVSLGYVDAIGVQVFSFIGTDFAAKYINNNLQTLFDVGSVEPLLVLA